MLNKCAVCGKFKSWDKLHGMSGDSDDCGNYEEWLECVDCMSQADRERYGVDNE